MDDIVNKPTTPEGCEQMAENAESRGNHALAQGARLRAIQLRAVRYGAESEVERAALEAAYAYERALKVSRGSKARASRTWQMIEQRGIIQAVERVVARRADSQGYRTLQRMGLQHMAFEAVVLRYEHAFSSKAVAQARARLEAWNTGDSDR